MRVSPARGLTAANSGSAIPSDRSERENTSSRGTCTSTSGSSGRLPNDASSTTSSSRDDGPPESFSSSPAPPVLNRLDPIWPSAVRPISSPNVPFSEAPAFAELPPFFTPAETAGSAKRAVFALDSGPATLVLFPTNAALVGEAKQTEDEDEDERRLQLSSQLTSQSLGVTPKPISSEPSPNTVRFLDATANSSRADPGSGSFNGSGSFKAGRKRQMSAFQRAGLHRTTTQLASESIRDSWAALDAACAFSTFDDGALPEDTVNYTAGYLSWIMIAASPVPLVSVVLGVTWDEIYSVLGILCTFVFLGHFYMIWCINFETTLLAWAAKAGLIWACFVGFPCCYAIFRLVAVDPLIQVMTYTPLLPHTQLSACSPPHQRPQLVMILGAMNLTMAVGPMLLGALKLVDKPTASEGLDVKVLEVLTQLAHFLCGAMGMAGIAAGFLLDRYVLSLSYQPWWVLWILRPIAFTTAKWAIYYPCMVKHGNLIESPEYRNNVVAVAHMPLAVFSALTVSNCNAPLDFLINVIIIDCFMFVFKHYQFR